MLHISAETLGDVAKILGSLGVIFAGSRYAYRKIKRTTEMLGRIAAEFANNGGSTMRDAVDRVEAAVVDIGRRVNDLEARNYQGQDRRAKFTTPPDPSTID